MGSEGRRRSISSARLGGAPARRRRHQAHGEPRPTAVVLLRRDDLRDGGCRLAVSAGSGTPITLVGCGTFDRDGVTTQCVLDRTYSSGLYQRSVRSVTATVLRPAVGRVGSLGGGRLACRHRPSSANVGSIVGRVRNAMTSSRRSASGSLPADRHRVAARSSGSHAAVGRHGRDVDRRRCRQRDRVPPIVVSCDGQPAVNRP